VDEHCIAFDLGEAGSHRIRALRTAFDELAHIDAGKRFGGKRLLAGSDNDPDIRNGGMRGECLDRSAKHRLATEGAILFRESAAQALASAGCDDESRCGHRPRV
jgi:hypothetical protein